MVSYASYVLLDVRLPGVPSCYFGRSEVLSTDGWLRHARRTGHPCPHEVIVQASTSCHYVPLFTPHSTANTTTSTTHTPDVWKRIARHTPTCSLPCESCSLALTAPAVATAYPPLGCLCRVHTNTSNHNASNLERCRPPLRILLLRLNTPLLDVPP